MTKYKTRWIITKNKTTCFYENIYYGIKYN